jgi:hypothetical protein
VIAACALAAPEASIAMVAAAIEADRLTLSIAVPP